MHCLLMVVPAEDEVNTDLRECAEDLPRVLQSVAPRELALHRIVMHHDNARVAGWRTLELLLRVIHLRAPDRADDGDVAETPGERVPRHPLRGIQPDERRARHAEHRLEILGDVRPIALEDALAVPDAERRVPPLYVVVAGHDDRLADALRIADERLRPLELTRPPALRQVPRDRDDVETAFLDDRLDRFDLVGHRRPAEMEIRDVKHRDHGAARRAT